MVVLLGIVLLASPAVLLAQGAPGDTLVARYQPLLNDLRDSLKAVLAAGWEFGRDLDHAGGETVLARAAAMRARCRAAAAALRDGEGRVDVAAFPRRVRERATRWRDAMGTLRKELLADCDTGLQWTGAGNAADSTRAWGPYRSGRVERSISAYEAAARTFAEGAGLRIEP